MLTRKGLLKMEGSEVKLNLYQKLVEVRKSIDGFTKDTKGYNYEYVSGTQVLAKIKDKMDECGLVLFPSITEQKHEIYPYKDKYGKDKIDFLVYGDMSYHWINAEKPDEVLIVPWKYTGQQDDISKAFGSSLTYAERYFLLKFFGVPTDSDDPDAKEPPKKDKNENKGSQQNQPPKTNNNNNNNNTPDGITEGQVKAVQVNLNNLSKAANTTKERLIVRLETEVGKFGSVTGMTKGQATKSISLLKGWIDTTNKQGAQQ